MFHCHHLTPHTALFSASKSPPQSQIPRSSHTYTTSRFTEINHGLPLTRWSCHFLFLSQGALQGGGRSVTYTDFTFVKHHLKPVLHKLLNSDTSFCVKGTKKKSTPLNFHSQILSKLSGVNITHLCKLVERHRLCLSAPKGSGRGAINKQL